MTPLNTVERVIMPISCNLNDITPNSAHIDLMFIHKQTYYRCVTAARLVASQFSKTLTGYSVDSCRISYPGQNYPVLNAEHWIGHVTV